MKVLLRSTVLLLGIYLAPTAFDVRQARLNAAEACPGEGCCFEPASICDIGGAETMNAYYSALGCK